MNKKLSILLTIFMVSVLSLTGCKKDAKDAVKDAKKDVNKLAGDVKANTKAVVNKIAGTNFAAKFDLSYFPEDSVVVGSVDIKKFLSIEILKPLLKKGLDQAKKEGIAIDKATFASWYMSANDLAAKNPEGAVIVNNLVLPKVLIDKMKPTTEKYNGIDLLVDTKEGGAMAILGKDTVFGELKSLKKMLDVKTGKGKSLTKAGSSKTFKDIMSKTGDSAFRIAFVPNALLTAEIKKGAQEQAPMVADFATNFKAASFGIGVGKDAFTFSINVRSSKAGIDQVVTLAKPYLGMIKQENSPMLGMTKQFLGEEGVKMLAAVVKTINLTNDGEYLSITFETKYEYWKKAPEIFAAAMGGMMQPQPQPQPQKK